MGKQEMKGETPLDNYQHYPRKEMQVGNCRKEKRKGKKVGHLKQGIRRNSHSIKFQDAP